MTNMATIWRGMKGFAGLLLASTLAFSSVAEAGDDRVEVPLEIGVGPVFNTWFGAIGRDQPIHTGLLFTSDVVLDRAWFRENPDQVPERWRKRVGYMDEVRIRPLWYLPESLVLSPRMRSVDRNDIDFDGNRTEARPSAFMLGASWRPFAIGLPILLHPVRIGVDIAPRLTLLYVNEGDPDRAPNTTSTRKTFFARPGADITADVILPIDDQVRIRVGADAQAYLPQALGGFGIGQRGERMAFLMRTFAEVRVRVPTKVKR